MKKEEDVLSYPLCLLHSYDNRCLWTLICSSIKHNLPLFVNNIIIIKRSEEINIVSRHALGNTVPRTCSACNITMRRSFIRFVNRSIINQTQDTAARMIVVTCTIKKTLHHAKPWEGNEWTTIAWCRSISENNNLCELLCRGEGNLHQPSNNPSRQQHVYTPHKVCWRMKGTVATSANSLLTKQRHSLHS